MKIVIAGAGEVGTHLAKLLSKEKQDIILLDTKEEKLQWIDSNYNLMTVTGSPTSFATLKKAGVHNADLFIAVTPSDDKNITACILASKLGAKKSVARVDNYEYIQPANMAFFKEMGVDELIYPELLATKEILSALKITWARKWFSLCDGKLILISTKIRENAQLINRKLSELTSEHNFYHIAAIKRKDETIIPRGNDQLLANDIVYFTTTPDHVQDLRKLTGKNDVNVNRVFVMGGSRIAILLGHLLPSSISMKLIEINHEKSIAMAEKMPNTDIINGDARDIDLLLEEGLESADAFIALTDSSETNILSCLAAKKLGVKKTVAEVENIPFISTAEGLDIGSIINKKIIAASRIYQILLDTDISDARCLATADAEVVELTVKEGAKITRANIKSLDIPKGLTLGGLVRNGKGEIINGNTQIEANDHVLLFCVNDVLHKIEKLFN
ncbi:MAG: Trk system potassium transporter TrkA [Bacteroidales bacterium]